MYWIFVDTFKRTTTCIPSWNQLYNIDIADWKIIFQPSFSCGHDTKLQSFQYRLQHRSIQTVGWGGGGEKKIFLI